MPQGTVSCVGSMGGDVSNKHLMLQTCTPMLNVSLVMCAKNIVFFKDLYLLNFEQNQVKILFIFSF